MNAHLDAARATQAAQALYELWKADAVTGALPEAVRPRSRAEGYAVQAALRALHGGSVPGWKIAATSVAGQRHIGVSGPLAGPIYAGRVYEDGAAVSLQGNRMRVAECEITFRFARTLAPRAQPYSVDEVLAAVGTVHPAIEVPDSRFEKFETAGEAQLIADNACCREYLLGPGLPVDERVRALPAHEVRAECSDGRRFSGTGANVLGDPLVALAWIVNELSSVNVPMQAGQFVTTGACVVPIPVTPGVEVKADFGWLGRMSVRFS
ncbi:MAG: hypothetical protein RL014_250 [Pseudomonadota bacterium]|jgi:2-keto-4-pentenoate hydratase